MIGMRTLAIFYWAVRLGGFGRAAARLNMTQPSVSSRIAALEAEYGVRLFDRERGSRPVLTRKGSELFAHAARMIALQGEAVGMLRDGDGLHGTIRIGVAETLVQLLLPNMLRRLHVEHPAVSPDVMTDISPNLRDALLAGELDLALMLGPTGIMGSRELTVCTLPIAWAASPDLPFGNATLTRADLAYFPVLTYARSTAPYADVARLLAASGLPPARTFPNGSLSAIVQLAVHGVGIAAIPPAVITRELADGSLRLLPSELRLPPLQFVACWLDPGPGLASAIADIARECGDATCGQEIGGQGFGGLPG